MSSFPMANSEKSVSFTVSKDLQLPLDNPHVLLHSHHHDDGFLNILSVIVKFY